MKNEEIPIETWKFQCNFEIDCPQHDFMEENDALKNASSLTNISFGKFRENDKIKILVTIPSIEI